MSPEQMAIAAVKIAQRYDDAVVIYPRMESGGGLLIAADADRVWPDCNADAVCEGAGEYRTVAVIDIMGTVAWTDPMSEGH